MCPRALELGDGVFSRENVMGFGGNAVREDSGDGSVRWVWKRLVWEQWMTVMQARWQGVCV